MSISTKYENIGPSGFIRKALWCGVAILLAQFSLLAATPGVAFAWEPSTNTAVTGYKIYYGASSHNYTSVMTVGTVTSASITNLAPGTTYYFAATTYDAAGNESAFSSEASYTVPVPSVPSVLATVVQSAGQFGFTVSGMAGIQYIVQATTNLIDWEPVQTNTAPFTFVDKHAASFSQRYYRTVEWQ